VVEVVVTEEFRLWYEGLSEIYSDHVYQVVEMLADRGVALRFPVSSKIHGTEINLRELRIPSAGAQFRVLYSFDPERQAVLLIAGDKRGNKRFYAEYIPRAERLWREYLAGKDAK
jgi:hypothetical protein